MIDYVIDHADDIRQMWHLEKPKRNVWYKDDPAWFVSLVKNHFGIEYPRFDNSIITFLKDDLETDLFDGSDRYYSSLFDHGGYLNFSGLTCPVFEPYLWGDWMLPHAAKLAELIGCDCYFSLRSWHAPGHTARIIYAPLGHKIAREEYSHCLTQPSARGYRNGN